MSIMVCMMGQGDNPLQNRARFFVGDGFTSPGNCLLDSVAESLFNRPHPLSSPQLLFRMCMSERDVVGASSAPLWQSKIELSSRLSVQGPHTYPGCFECCAALSATPPNTVLD